MAITSFFRPPLDRGDAPHAPAGVVTSHMPHTMSETSGPRANTNTSTSKAQKQRKTNTQTVQDQDAEENGAEEAEAEEEEAEEDDCDLQYSNNEQESDEEANDSDNAFIDDRPVSVQSMEHEELDNSLLDDDMRSSTSVTEAVSQVVTAIRKSRGRPRQEIVKRPRAQVCFDAPKASRSLLLQ